MSTLPMQSNGPLPKSTRFDLSCVMFLLALEISILNFLYLNFWRNSEFIYTTGIYEPINDKIRQELVSKHSLGKENK